MFSFWVCSASWNWGLMFFLFWKVLSSHRLLFPPYSLALSPPGTPLKCIIYSIISIYPLCSIYLSLWFILDNSYLSFHSSLIVSKLLLNLICWNIDFSYYVFGCYQFKHFSLVLFYSFPVSYPVIYLILIFFFSQTLSITTLKLMLSDVGICCYLKLLVSSLCMLFIILSYFHVFLFILYLFVYKVLFIYVIFV